MVLVTHLCSAMDDASSELKRVQDDRNRLAVDIDVVVELKQGQVEVCGVLMCALCHRRTAQPSGPAEPGL